MNSITRLILRHVASGKVKLTPRLIQDLKKIEQDQPAVAQPRASVNESSSTPEQSDRATATNEKHLTFVSPLPGRWIRRMECVVGIALLLAASLAHAVYSPATFEAANNDFAQDKYTAAAQGYESIIAQNGYSDRVLFNLANAQQRAGQLGLAILNYERAALLNPNDRNLAANLDFARKKAGLVQAPQTLAQRASRLLTMNTWFGFAAASLFLLTVTLPLKQLRPQARGTINFGGLLAALALLSAIGALGVRGMDLRRAVVTVPEAVAGVSPVTMAQPIFRLRAGEGVTLQKTHGTFALVRNCAGQAGWVKSDEITRVVPIT